MWGLFSRLSFLSPKRSIKLHTRHVKLTHFFMFVTHVILLLQYKSYYCDCDPRAPTFNRLCVSATLPLRHRINNSAALVHLLSTSSSDSRNSGVKNKSSKKSCGLTGGIERSVKGKQQHGRRSSSNSFGFHELSTLEI
jgi:hypothetical protein